jgi:hypothetical protein
MPNCKNCGVELEFSEEFKSKSGKFIPLEDGEPHKCKGICTWWDKWDGKCFKPITKMKNRKWANFCDKHYLDANLFIAVRGYHIKV